MQNTNAFAFYGSLRRGMENHHLHAPHLKYLFSARLRGFSLFSRGPFPVAVLSGQTTDSMVVEVFEIKDATTREMIHKLEMDEGYYLHHVQVGDVTAAIYLFKTPENYPKVNGGDWVSFFRQKV